MLTLQTVDSTDPYQPLRLGAGGDIAFPRGSAQAETLGQDARAVLCVEEGNLRLISGLDVQS